MCCAPIEAARAGLATDGGTSAAHGVGEAGVDGREDNGEEQLDWRHLGSRRPAGDVCFVTSDDEMMAPTAAPKIEGIFKTAATYDHPSPAYQARPEILSSSL